MTAVRRVFVVSVGVVSPAGRHREGLAGVLLAGSTGIGALSLFSPGQGEPLPVGQVGQVEGLPGVPRAHALAEEAAFQAMAGEHRPPDAVVLGGTTGGMFTTEQRMVAGVADPRSYRFHGTGSVARWVAQRVGCEGPAITVSTACSSGAAALKLGLELMRQGRADRVLAGGADSLCRLTYNGFRLLQLIDPQGGRPLDRDRRGMTVSEGAAILLLQAATSPPPGALSELAGGGLSCDAYHPTAPHPEGDGAATAMQRALADAGLDPSDVDYINLHGTGTRDNDEAEARAILRVFGEKAPALSSTKGISGHTLAAAGALEAAIATVAVDLGIRPANIGLERLDDGLGLLPLRELEHRPVGTVLSNSFGFGGNNGSLVICDPHHHKPRVPRTTADRGVPTFEVLAVRAITGVGDTDATMAALDAGERCLGQVPSRSLCAGLPLRSVRRLKRLPRLAVDLAEGIRAARKGHSPPKSVFFGTAWGPLSETHDFLRELLDSDQEYASPTDFVGSVHNAPAGQVALRQRIRGPNLTVTDGDVSFEEALHVAGLLATARDEPLLLMGADEHHPFFSPLVDPHDTPPADGGGALVLRRALVGAEVRLRSLLFVPAGRRDAVGTILSALGGGDAMSARYAAIWVSIPATQRDQGEPQLEALLKRAPYHGPVWRYRPWLGEFGTVSAVATALACEACRRGRVPTPGDPNHSFVEGNSVLLLSLGEVLGAVEVV